LKLRLIQIRDVADWYEYRIKRVKITNQSAFDSQSGRVRSRTAGSQSAVLTRTGGAKGAVIDGTNVMQRNELYSRRRPFLK